MALSRGRANGLTPITGGLANSGFLSESLLAIVSSPFFSVGVSSFLSLGKDSGFFSVGVTSGFFSFGVASGFFSLGVTSGFFSVGATSGFLSLGVTSGFFSVGAASGLFSLGLTSSFFSDGVLSLETSDFLTEGTFSFSFFFSGGVFSTSGMVSEVALCLLCLGESPFFFFSAETQRQVSSTKRSDQHKIILRWIY